MWPICHKHYPAYDQINDPHFAHGLASAGDPRQGTRSWLAIRTATPPGPPYNTTRTKPNERKVFSLSRFDICLSFEPRGISLPKRATKRLAHENSRRITDSGWSDSGYNHVDYVQSPPISSAPTLRYAPAASMNGCTAVSVGHIATNRDRPRVDSMGLADRLTSRRAGSVIRLSSIVEYALSSRCNLSTHR